MSACAAAVGILLSLTAVGQTYTLKFAAPDGTTATMAMRAELKDIQLGGTSMGLTGSVQANMKVTVLSHDEEKKTFRLSIELSDVNVVFNGAPQGVPPTPPVVVEIDERGRIVKIEGQASLDAADLVASAGMPVQILGVAMVAAWFPEREVAVGEEWSGEAEVPTAFGTAAIAKFTCRLVKVDGEEATLAGEAEATMPPFQMPNPLQPGTQMTVSDGKILTRVAGQVVGTGTGLTSQTAGEVEISMTADMGGMQLPISLSAYFAGAKDDDTAAKLLERVQKGGPLDAGAEEAAPAQGAPAGEGAATATQASGAGEVVEVGENDFAGKVLHADKPVLVDFYATWCPPCKQQRPVVEKLAAQYAGRVLFVAVDVDKSPQLANQYQIEAVPTLIIFRGGEQVWRKTGLTDEKQLRAALDARLSE